MENESILMENGCKITVLQNSFSYAISSLSLKGKAIVI